MKTLIPMASLVCCVFVLEGSAQDAKKGDIKYNVEHLEKSWGIKLKAAVVDVRMAGGSEIKLTLEFSKDVESLQEMRDAFRWFFALKEKYEPKLYFYAFDEDNVTLAKMAIKNTEGELTGKKGDAFRLALTIGNTDLQKTKKIEARPAETSKDKK